MIKYFYKVVFNYEIEKDINGNPITNGFDLGIFSTKKNANEKIELCKNMNGFKNFSIDNFNIIKFGVHFSKELESKSNIKLYYVFHEYTIIEQGVEYDIWNTFDCFSTKEESIKKIEQLKLHSRIGKKYPNNFGIDECTVDDYNSWSEGFSSFDD